MIMMYQIWTHELLLYIDIFSSSSWWYQSLMPFYSACELNLDDISPNEVQQGGQGAVTEVLRCRPWCVYGAPPPSGVENETPLTNYVTMMWPEWEANWFSAELMWEDGCYLHLVESVGTSAWHWSIGDFSILKEENIHVLCESRLNWFGRIYKSI